MNLKIIVGILVALIVIQIIGAVVFFSLSAKSGPPLSRLGSTHQQASSAPNNSAKIMLSADKTTLKVGESVVVSVNIDSGATPVDGVDISLGYDPKVLEPILVNKMPFVPGRLFPETPFNAFDLKIGTASMSAISAMNKNFVGSGTVGVISFRAKEVGNATIRVNAQPGNTTDSNIVAGDGKELSVETKDVSLTILK